MSQPSTPVGAWIRRQGPAFWIGIAGAVLLLIAAVGLLAIATTVSTLRAADDATLDGEPLRYITSFGAWFAFAGGALLLIAAIASSRRG